MVCVIGERGAAHARGAACGGVERLQERDADDNFVRVGARQPVYEGIFANTKTLRSARASAPHPTNRDTRHSAANPPDTTPKRATVCSTRTHAHTRLSLSLQTTKPLPTTVTTTTTHPDCSEPQFQEKNLWTPLWWGGGGRWGRRTLHLAMPLPTLVYVHQFRPPRYRPSSPRSRPPRRRPEGPC